jgi:hypothetical protein
VKRTVNWSVGQLIYAKKWERAAIVYALTHRDARMGRPIKSIEVWTYRSLASRGIVGLTTEVSVTRYHDAWQAAVDAGEAQPAQLRCHEPSGQRPN